MPVAWIPANLLILARLVGHKVIQEAVRLLFSGDDTRGSVLPGLGLAPNLQPAIHGRLVVLVTFRSTVLNEDVFLLRSCSLLRFETLQ